MTYAIASNDETLDHLQTLFETGSLKEKELYNDLHGRIETLGKKLNRFIQIIEKDLRLAAINKSSKVKSRPVHEVSGSGKPATSS